MAEKKVHEQQGTLFEDSTPEAPITGASVEVEDRARHLYRVLGHFAYLSQTANYETIDVNPWFQRRISQQHPHDYQQHVDERLGIRARRRAAAATDFGEAFGISALVEDGGMAAEEAESMAKDFYNGTNHSGYNPDRQSFQRSYADQANNKRLNTLRRKLEKQNPELKR